MARMLAVVIACAIGCGEVHPGGGGGGGGDDAGGGDAGTGTGEDADPGGFTVSPPSLDFGEVSAATPQVVRTMTITNTTRQAAALGVAFTGDDAASFAVMTNTCQPVAAGGSCAIDIALTSGHLGTYSAASVLAGTGLQVPLAAHAVAAQLAISPNNDDFGDVALAATTTRQYTMTNSGDATLPSPGAAIAGGAAYTLLASNCPPTLAPGASCSFGVRFKPTALGAQTATATATAGTLSAQAAIHGRGTAQLSASVQGAGAGSISGGGLSCGAACTATVASTPIAVTVATVNGSAFNGWGGAAQACGTTPTCNIPITAATVSISATFSDLPTLTLDVINSDSQGTVTLDRPATSCDGTCVIDYLVPTTVTLRPIATQSTCTHFSGWFGACSGNGNCTIVVDSNVSVSAGFDRIPNCDPS